LALAPLVTEVGGNSALAHRRPRAPIAIMPAYQAEASVGALVRELMGAWPLTGIPRVIVVDDGSTDDTAAAAQDAGAMVVRHAQNSGKGAALRSGLRRALVLGADVAVTVDADGQHPPEEALRLATLPVSSDTLVLGVRDLVGAGAPRANQFSNGFSNVFISWFSGRRLLDTQCGLRRYPVQRTLALEVRASGYGFEAEIILRAAHAGWDIEQVPVRVIYPPESERVSHFHSVRDPARIVARVLHTFATAPRMRK
jgi:glycosyltransferase involved in cell wall biosynthesis